MKKRLKWIIPLGTVLVLAVLFFVYVGVFYHADETAKAALESDGIVTVTLTDYGWFFDGPSEEDTFIFYPGAKVEAAAYAPMLKRLASEGMDVYLVEMPFNLAVLGMNKAESIMAGASYENWYIGGHSIGGAVAANYAAAHPEELAGVILFAAYPTRKLEDSLLLLSIYGTEDGVLKMEKVEEGRAFAPEDYLEFPLEGGNHAQFGNYGKQSGDREARIPREEQQRRAVEFVMEHKR